MTTVSPWNQNLGLQGGSVTAGSSFQLAMVARNIAAITVSTPFTSVLYSAGGTYSLWVFDQTNGGFGQVTRLARIVV